MAVASLVVKTLTSLPSVLAVQALNLLVLLLNRGFTIRRRRDGLLEAKDRSGAWLVFVHLERVGFLLRGVESRIAQIGSEYHLDLIELRAGDVVIDVGANIGEFSRAAYETEPDLRVVAVEPELREIEALRRNLSPYVNWEVEQRPLWSFAGESTWYSEPSSGDSSLIRGLQADGLRVVRTTTLSALLSERGVGTVRLLKLEAEGAEPEVLEGAIEMLDRIDFISVDCGPERGPYQETTVHDVKALLEPNGFTQLASNKRGVILFRREV